MAGERILVIDDDRVTSRFLSSLLTAEGYDVLLAENGEQALDLAGRHAFELVLGELVIPYRDRSSVLRAFRDDERLGNVPLVILSVRDREEDVVHGLEEGADDYMVKPFNARELLVRIRKQLDRGKPVR